VRDKLTEKVIAAVQPSGVIWDTQLTGLGVRRQGAGRTSFVCRYVSPAGRRRQVTIGFAGTISLELARRQARVILGEVASGGDPLAAKRARRTRSSLTLRRVVEDWREAQLRAGRRSVERAMAQIRRNWFKSLGDVPVTDISRRKIAAEMAIIAKEHGIGEAAVALARLRAVLRWCAQAHPLAPEQWSAPQMAGLMPKREARQRTLTDAEIRAIWLALDQHPSRPYAALVRLLLLTGARREEINGMRWDELDASGVWRLPPERDKGLVGRALCLSPHSLTIVRELPRLGSFVIGGAAPLKSLAAHKRTLDRLSGVTEWVLHDLRRTARTILARLRIPRETAEAVLGHRPPHLVAIYDRHMRHDEIADALRQLGSHIARAVSDSDESVVLLARGG
jgi:integrase